MKPAARRLLFAIETAQLRRGVEEQDRAGAHTFATWPRRIAILLGIEEDELEETARAIRQAKAHLALSRMRRQAARRGIDRMPTRAIDAEIRAVRSKRKSA